MALTLREFLAMRADFAWALELAVCALSWVMLRCSVSEKLKLRRVVLEYLLLLAGMAAGNTLMIALTYPSFSFTFFWAVLMGAITYVYLWFFAPYRRKTMTLLWLALYTCSLSVMSLAGQCSILMGTFLSAGAAEALIRLFIYLLIPAVAWLLRRLNFDDFRVVPKSGLWMLGFGTLCVLLLYVVEIRFMMADYRITITLAVSYVCMFAMTVSAIQALHNLCREQNALLELQAEKQRLVAEREMKQMAENTLEDLRCIRHDLKNQYSYMQILLEEQRYEELQQYFAKLSDNLPTQLNMIDCGNRTVNTVLNMELGKLKSDRIVFEHQLVVPPVLPFPDEDICSIITNLLDNASDECRRLLKKGAASVKVRLEIYPHQSYLFIKCLNSTDRVALSRAKGGLRTTKEDEQMHGYGTRIITKLAEKHNGCADYSLEGESFVAQVMLDMTEEITHEN